MPTTEANVSETLTNCPLCGEALGANPNECSKCDWIKGYRQREMFSISRRDAAAALLSLAVPGLGHIYKGHTTLAVLLLGGAAIVSAFAVAFFAFVFPVPASPILLVCYWGFVFIHACAANDLNPPSREIIGKMIAMLIAGVIGGALTITLALRFMHLVG